MSKRIPDAFKRTPSTFRLSEPLVDEYLEHAYQAGFPGPLVRVRLTDFDGPLRCFPKHEVLEITSDRMTAKVRRPRGAEAVLRRRDWEPTARWEVLEGAMELASAGRDGTSMRCLPKHPSLFPLVSILTACPLVNPLVELERQKQLDAGGPPRWELCGNGLESWWIGLRLMHAGHYFDARVCGYPDREGVLALSPLPDAEAGAASPASPIPLSRAWGLPRPDGAFLLSRACGPAVEWGDFEPAAERGLGTQEYRLAGKPVTMSQVRACTLAAECSEFARQVRAAALRWGFEVLAATPAGQLRLRRFADHGSYAADLEIGTDYAELSGPAAPRGQRLTGPARRVVSDIAVAISKW